jgi:hypothetical protein
MIFFVLACTAIDIDPEVETGLIGLLVTPTDLIIPVGSTVQLEAVGLTQDRETVPLTDSVDWSIEHYSIGSISEELDSEGRLETRTEGNTRIYAQYEDIRSPYVNVIVTAATLERLTIHPNEANIVEGESIQISATGYFSNGSSGDFTQQARWVTANGSVAQIPSAGKIKGISAGETRIHATYETLSSESIPITVQPFIENGSPDLIIEEANGFIYNGNALFEVKIKNQGSASAIDFWVDVWGNRTSPPSEYDIGDQYQQIPYLSPNHYAMLSFEFPYSENSAESWIEIDTSNNIEENRESNNSLQLSIESIEMGGTSDLSIDFFDTVLNSDQTRSYFVDVTNNGSEVVSYLFVDLYPDQNSPPQLNTDGELYIAIEDLGPGETAWADFVYENPCVGCTSWCMVDSLDFVHEINENNNIGGPLEIP